MQLKLIADKTIKGRIYPALAAHQARPYTASWREFGQHWPYTTPLRLQEYCDQHGVHLVIESIDNFSDRAWYPICFGFFDFAIDYISLVPLPVQNAIQQRGVKLLFYYHEGDNPKMIKQRIDKLLLDHGLPTQCYVFISANSAADSLDQFVAFHDFELWYHQRNLAWGPCAIHSNTRSKEFTCLSRLHKWWRATVMSDLFCSGILDQSYWSYCEPAHGTDTDCPIEVDQIAQLRHHRSKFLADAPYFCDAMSDSERNNHSVLNRDFYTNAYCNIVLESQFDVDQSGGAFITEKTFKPIKHGQLFFIAGAAGSLQQLRNLGYCTFDNLLDNSYDTIINSTQRWTALKASIVKARSHLPQIYAAARPELEHNQKLFVANKSARLNRLIERIHEKSC